MLINLQFFSVTQAGREAMYRQIEKDEASLPDYKRPLCKVKIPKKLFDKETTRHAFGAQCYKLIQPLLP